MGMPVLRAPERTLPHGLHGLRSSQEKPRGEDGVMREGGTTIRLPEDLRAEARHASESHGSFNRFVAWVIRQALRLEFLSAGNREFVLKVASELGQPWDVLAVLNLLVGYARGEARARKLLDLLFARNDFFGPAVGHMESRELTVSQREAASPQVLIEFSQGSTETAAGEVSPSPKKCEPSPAYPKGAARG